MYHKLDAAYSIHMGIAANANGQNHEWSIKIPINQQSKMLVKAESAAAHPSKNNCFALNVKQDLELFCR